jgi:flagellar biosynthesis protein FlhF
MKIRRFFAKDMRSALKLVSRELGPEAAILSSGKVAGGVEVVAATDYDEALMAARQPERDGSRVDAARGSAESEPQPSASPVPEQKRSFSAVLDDASVADDAGEEPLVRPTPAPAGKSWQDEQVEWLEDPALARLRESLTDEMQLLRHLIESQMAQFGWAQKKRKDPIYCEMLRRLVNMGFPVSLAHRYAANIKASEVGDAWYKVAAQLARDLPVVAKDPLAEGGVFALVGPTGVGKTTTLAKLAARAVLRFGPDAVALVSTDSYRIAAREQLDIYAQLLGVDVFTATQPEELQQVLDGLRDKQAVFVDTAGVGQRDERLAEQVALLAGGVSTVKAILVLSATSQTTTLLETQRKFARLPLFATILTKLDEATSLGPVLAATMKFGLPVCYVTNGQRVPEDIRPAQAHELMAEAVRLSNEYPLEKAEEWRIAQSLVTGASA